MGEQPGLQVVMWKQNIQTRSGLMLLMSRFRCPPRVVYRANALTQRPSFVTPIAYLNESTPPSISVQDGPAIPGPRAWCSDPSSVGVEASRRPPIDHRETPPKQRFRSLTAFDFPHGSIVRRIMGLVSKLMSSCESIFVAPPLYARGSARARTPSSVPVWRYKGLTRLITKLCHHQEISSIFRILTYRIYVHLGETHLVWLA
ncbi:hypothetical protein C8Q79DRAFT_423438 [Trametes meyenii]|nr:hypothetical protein C8Q79DRAFT_423438 [Trametes meyenii]